MFQNSRPQFGSRLSVGLPRRPAAALPERRLLDLVGANARHCAGQRDREVASAVP